MLGFTLALATLLPVALSGVHCDDAYHSGVAGEARANGWSIIDLISNHTYSWMVLQARPFPVGLAAGLSANYFGGFDPLWPKLAHIFLAALAVVLVGLFIAAFSNLGSPA